MSRRTIYYGILALGVFSPVLVYRSFAVQDVPGARPRTLDQDTVQAGSPVVISPGLASGLTASSLTDRYRQAAVSERGPLLIQMARTGDPAVVPVLIGALQDTNGDVRSKAYVGLQYMLHTTFDFQPLKASPPECQKFARMMQSYWDTFEKAWPQANEMYWAKKKGGHKERP